MHRNELQQKELMKKHVRGSFRIVFFAVSPSLQAFSLFFNFTRWNSQGFWNTKHHWSYVGYSTFLGVSASSNSPQDFKFFMGAGTIYELVWMGSYRSSTFISCIKGNWQNGSPTKATTSPVDPEFNYYKLMLLTSSVLHHLTQ